MSNLANYVSLIRQGASLGQGLCLPHQTGMPHFPAQRLEQDLGLSSFTLRTLC